MANITDTVITNGYCIGCGACASIPESPFRVALDARGQYVASYNGQSSEERQLSSSKVCPFANESVDEDVIGSELFGATCRYDPVLGYYRDCYAAYTLEEPFRKHGSSGGIGSWICARILRGKMVTGVIHVRPRQRDAADPRLFEYSLSSLDGQVKAGAGSRYYPVEMSQVLAQLRGLPGTYAFVGLPCFIKAIRLLARQDPELAKKIRFCIGLVCGHLKSVRFSDLLALQLGFDPREVESIDFRKKLPDAPANRYGVEVVGQKGCEPARIVRPIQELDGGNWGHGYFKYKACDYCDDIFAETADIVIGDAWLPEYVQDSAGTNIIVVRDPELATVLDEARENRQLHLEAIPARRAVQSQAANVRHRREDLPYRLFLADRNGTWRPRKRTSASARGLDRRRKRLAELRIRIAEESHEAFRECANKGLAFFRTRMNPLLSRYQAMYAANSSRNLWRWTKRVVRAVARRCKNLVLGGCFPLYLFWLRATRRLRRLSGAVVLPPSSPGSLGDEAALNGLVGALRRQNVEPITMLSYSQNSSWQHVQGNPPSLPIDKYFRKGRIASLFRFAHLLASHERFYVLGTDVLDGFYDAEGSVRRIHLLRFAAAIGVQTAAVGFSFSSNAKQETVAALRRLPSTVRFCIRDAISKSAFQRLVGRDASLVADPAFLLQPVEDSQLDETIVSWIRARKQEGKVVLGVNINHLLVRQLPGMTAAKLVRSYCELLTELLKQNHDLAFCLIPHDTRGRPNDVELATSVVASIADETKSVTTLVPFPCSSAAVKGIVRGLDCVFSGKMHLAIASLGQCTPVGCMTYKDKKFDGLFQHFGLDDVTISPNSLACPHETASFVQSLIDRRVYLKERIEAELPHVMSLAAENLQGYSS